MLVMPSRNLLMAQSVTSGNFRNACRVIQPHAIDFSNPSLYDGFWQAIKAELRPSSFTFWTSSLVTNPAPAGRC